MIALLASVLCGGAGCNVVVANRAYQTYTPTYNYQQAYTPYNYQSHAVLAYAVEDPERAALVRQNEKLTDALIAEVKASRERADRYEAAGGAEDAKPLAAPKAAAASIIGKNCAGCHTGEKFKGGFQLTVNPTPAQVVAQKIAINEVVSKGVMPPKDKPQLSPAEKKLIAEWAVVSLEEVKVASAAK